MADCHGWDGLVLLLLNLSSPRLSRHSPAVSDQGGGDSEVVLVARSLHDGLILDVFLLELQVYMVEEVARSHQGPLRV